MKTHRIVSRQPHTMRYVIVAFLTVNIFTAFVTSVDDWGEGLIVEPGNKRVVAEYAAREVCEQIEGEMVLVKGGCFKMGNTFKDGDEDEKPVHKVCVDDFYLGRYEITNKQFAVFLNDACRSGGMNKEFWFTINEDEYCYISGDIGNFRVRSGYEDHPVACVSWYGATAFAKWISGETGRGYRLPTEAEWEYAVKSRGKKEKWSGTGDESRLGEYAWYKENSGDKTHPVGQKKPNALGLYDMSGNVWEWAADWYDKGYYQKSSRNNTEGPPSGSERVVRGGSCDNSPSAVRTANRVGYTPGGRGYDIGFRLARTP